ncbi:carboxypeptidase-like regulatory domain-containing protein [Halogeometricum sp. S1BR25-6]|uniref:Carboxypeptidase-like regulatory domain-containing protein n=1 Tax=Halogeometricum salsisoli TaxID=2950536 RepID=A0ABU2GM46_9EURY|nr:carboxypeptidase-like regulatory domain-containing protein [Halogeometricum sp. S1BR25-6]MDS0301133.1 carboxypeptidase-like regulatory domain-containing protein [Halogeometricum sp. S1BR25-6]
MPASDRLGERLGTSTARLSLAVRPVDAFAGTCLRDQLTVRLSGAARPVPSPSGHFLFFDLDETKDPRTVIVTSEDRFLPTEVAVTLADLEPLSPVIEVPLTPAPAYRFPAWATLVRGRVLTAATEPVADATITLSGLDTTGRTDDRGEFVVGLPPLDARDVVERDGRRVVVPAGDPLTVMATHPTLDLVSESTEVTVTEGETVSVSLSLVKHD